jgi:hypothetical protein
MMFRPVCELTNVQSDGSTETKIVDIIEILNYYIGGQCINSVW